MTEPFRPLAEREGREGLGFGAKNEELKVEEVIRNHVQKADVEDLCLGPDLEVEEEKIVKKVGGKLGMKVEEVERNKELYLIVHSKLMIKEVVKELHRRDDGKQLYVGGDMFTLVERAEEEEKPEVQKKKVEKTGIYFNYEREKEEVLSEKTKKIAIDIKNTEENKEEDPLEYDSKIEEPEPRFAEVVEGDEGAAEDYDGEGEKLASS